VTRDESDDIWSHLVAELYTSVWSDDIFGHLVAECECIEFDYLETETELMSVRGWQQYYRERCLFGWWPNCCVSSVSPRDVFLTAGARAYQKHVLHGPETVSIFVLCELEFFPSSWCTLCLVRMGIIFEFGVSSPTKSFIIRLYIYSLFLRKIQ